MKNHTTRAARRFATAAAVATCGTALALGPAVGGAAAADCGAAAVMQPGIDHINSAHLETSPYQQARDLMSVDSYVLAHTVLAESILAPLIRSILGAESPAVDHINSAHLETSPYQQVADLLKVNDYVLAHTVLVESMLAPVLSGTGCPGGSAAAAPAPAPAAPAAPAPAPATAPAHGMGHSMGTEASSTTTEVTMSGLKFSPATVTVPAGSTVTWTNKEDAPHTITSKGGSDLKSKNLQKGGSFSHTFTAPGAYNYYCTVHPNMMGTVNVQGATSS